MSITDTYKSRKEITAILSLSVEKMVNPKNDPRIYMAREVTFDYATSNSIRVDFMRFKPDNNSVSGIEKGDFYCYEVKSSVEDFHSKNGHNFIGEFNYYVMPAEVYAIVSKEIPHFVGVYVPTEKGRDNWYNLSCVKKAKRRDRQRPMSEMLLMMFRSYARDKNKVCFSCSDFVHMLNKSGFQTKEYENYINFINDSMIDWAEFKKDALYDDGCIWRKSPENVMETECGETHDRKKDLKKFVYCPYCRRRIIME